MTLVIMDGKLLSFLAVFFPAFFMLYLAHGSPNEGGGGWVASKPGKNKERHAASPRLTCE